MQVDMEEGTVTEDKLSPEGVIKTWLDGVEGSVGGRGEPSDLGLLHSTCQTKREGQPSTPHKHLLPAIILDHEPSPTSTYFTNPTVFDKPDGQRHDEKQGDDNASSSSVDTFPTPESVIDAKLSSEAVTTSFVLGAAPLKGFRNWSTRSQGTAQSLTSYEPPTEREAPLTASPAASFATAPTPDDPDKERTVIIVSCLQCTLQDLPCSRTLPFCSRCERNGHGRLCLVQRMKLCEEIVVDYGIRVSEPVLLRVKGEEDSLWLTKLFVHDQASISVTEVHVTQKSAPLTSSPLLNKWQDEQDRKNWVLPINDQRRGNYWTCGNKYAALKHHPGEGIGKMARMMLKVELA